MNRVFCSPFFHLFLIAVIGFLAYSNTFSVPFQFDDADFIDRNPFIKHPCYFIDSSSEGDIRINKNLELTRKTRSVGFLSFWLNYRLNGMEVKGYHIFNLAIHIFNAFLFYWLIITTFRTPFLSARGASAGGIALLSALLFVAHPVQTQAVTYISQRFASLAATFYLGSVVLYARWRLLPNPANRRQGELEENFSRLFTVSPLRRFILYLLSLLSALLAMNTKENAFTLPAVIILYDFMFLSGHLKKRIFYLAPPVVIAFIIAVVSLSGSGLDNATRAQTEMERLDYLLTQFRVIVTYLRLLVFPANQNLDYDYPVYSSFASPVIFASFLFLLPIVGFGVFLFHRMRDLDSRARAVSFGIMWFFLTLSVESSVIPIIDIIFEHRLYLPSVGAFMAFAVGSSMLLRRHGTLKTASAVLIVSLLVFATYARNKVWASGISLWSDTVKKSPLKARPHGNLGFAYLKEGMNESAVGELTIALKLNPDYAIAHNNLGTAYKNTGRYGDAMGHFLAAVRLDPGYAEAHNNLGIAYRNTGRIDDAIKHYNIALSLEPDSYEVHNNLGVAYAAKGLAGKALERYEEALRLKPDYAEAHINLGNAYDSEGLSDKAIEHYEAAMRLRPDIPDVYNNIGAVYQTKGMSEKAIEYYEIAVRLRPDYAEAHFNLGRAYSAVGRADEAGRHLGLALGLRPDLARALKR